MQNLYLKQKSPSKGSVAFRKLSLQQSWKSWPGTGHTLSTLSRSPRWTAGGETAQLPALAARARTPTPPASDFPPRPSQAPRPPHARHTPLPWPRTASRVITEIPQPRSHRKQSSNEDVLLAIEKDATFYQKCAAVTHTGLCRAGEKLLDFSPTTSYRDEFIGSTPRSFQKEPGLNDQELLLSKQSRTCMKCQL